MPDGDGIQATRRILAREPGTEVVILTRRLTMRLVDSMRRTRADGAGIRPVRSRLTPREWEALDLLCASQSTDEIADTLVLSSETVRSHIKNLLRKLGVSSRQAAVEEARKMRAGLAVAEEPAGPFQAAAA
jgi:NarL family two-component system response regulator LiaR